MVSKYPRKKISRYFKPSTWVYWITGGVFLACMILVIATLTPLPVKKSDHFTYVEGRIESCSFVFYPAITGKYGRREQRYIKIVFSDNKLPIMRMHYKKEEKSKVESICDEREYISSEVKTSRYLNMPNTIKYDLVNTMNSSGRRILEKRNFLGW